MTPVPRFLGHFVEGFLVYLTFIILFWPVCVNMTIKHFLPISRSSPPIVEKGVNVAISMVQQLQHLNPCPLLKKMPNVSPILKDSQNDIKFFNF